MRLVCPQCATAYDVPDPLVLATPGRLVRCTNCGHQWAPVPAVPLPPLEAQAEVAAEPEARAQSVAEPEPASAPATPPSIRAADRPIASAPTAPSASRIAPVLWAASLVVLAALIWAGVHFRHQIVGVWAPSARLYIGLGLRY